MFEQKEGDNFDSKINQDHDIPTYRHTDMLTIYHYAI